MHPRPLERSSAYSFDQAERIGILRQAVEMGAPGVATAQPHPGRDGWDVAYGVVTDPIGSEVLVTLASVAPAAIEYTPLPELTTEEFRRRLWFGALTGFSITLLALSWRKS